MACTLPLNQQILDAIIIRAPQVISRNVPNSAIAILMMGFSATSLSSGMDLVSLAVVRWSGLEEWKPLESQDEEVD